LHRCFSDDSADNGWRGQASILKKTRLPDDLVSASQGLLLDEGHLILTFLEYMGEKTPQAVLLKE